ncbi:MAG: carbonic anhydrase [Verrucomicrobiia bacterium]|jgi:carbonic anhydrase
MRLFETILDANHRAAAGDKRAGVHVADFAEALPVVALTCIDPRLNPLMPEVLGLPEEQFIWLRNAGNIITGSMSSTIRSLALACVVKGGKEIAVIGHTDCRAGQTTVLQLTERFNALGVNRSKLPDNLVEFFGVFASERQNVMKAVDFVRHSPIIGPKTPVHGLLVDIQSGRLEWLVNGYQVLDAAAAQFAEAINVQNSTMQTAFASPEPDAGEKKPSETKIGEAEPVTGWSVKDAKVVEVLTLESPPKVRLVEEKPPHAPAPKRPPVISPFRNRPRRNF